MERSGEMTKELEPLPCAGLQRDDKPCSGTDEIRYSLGLYAGRWCDSHWETSGYRKEGKSYFKPSDAGESYDDEDGESWFNDGDRYDEGFGIGDEW